jgi:hypothetical protein
MWTRDTLGGWPNDPDCSTKDCNKLTPHLDSWRQSFNALWESDSSKLCYKSCLSWYYLSCLACPDSTSSSDGDFHPACLRGPTSGAQLELLQERTEMKFLLAILFLVFAQLSYAQGQNQTGADILNLAIKELPPCAVSTENHQCEPRSDRRCTAEMHAQHCWDIVMRAYRHRLHQRQQTSLR